MWFWAKYLDCKHKDLHFGVASDLREAPGEDKEETKEVNLESIRDLNRLGLKGLILTLAPT